VWHISHVINYDMPETVDAYMHRIGRTGRAARTGVAFTLVTHDDTAMVSTLERVLGAPLERRTLHDFEYATPRSAYDTNRGRAPRGRQPQRAQATAAHGGAPSGSSAREETPGATPAPPLPSAPGRRPQRSSGRRWQPAVAVRHWW
jgi:ATP-dependent RNA helicase RhlE